LDLNLAGNSILAARRSSSSSFCTIAVGFFAVVRSMCGILLGTTVSFFFLGGGEGDLLESLELAASLLDDGLGWRFLAVVAAGDFLLVLFLSGIGEDLRLVDRDFRGGGLGDLLELRPLELDLLLTERARLVFLPPLGLTLFISFACFKIAIT